MPFKLEALFLIETSLEFLMQFEINWMMYEEWVALFLIQNIFCHHVALHWEDGSPKERAGG